MNGWMGRVLRVDLASGEARETPFEPAMWKAFLGGRGAGAKVLFDALRPGTDPLGTSGADSPAEGDRRDADAALLRAMGLRQASHFPYRPSSILVRA